MTLSSSGESVYYILKGVTPNQIIIIIVIVLVVSVILIVIVVVSVIIIVVIVVVISCPCQSCPRVGWTHGSDGLAGRATIVPQFGGWG